MYLVGCAGVDGLKEGSGFKHVNRNRNFWLDKRLFTYRRSGCRLRLIVEACGVWNLIYHAQETASVKKFIHSINEAIISRLSDLADYRREAGVYLRLVFFREIVGIIDHALMSSKINSP